MSSSRGRSNAVAADYEWIKGDDLFEAYCVTLVRGVTPREFMDRIGAQIKFDSLPLGDEEYLDEKFSEIFYNDWTDLHGAGEMFIGATTAMPMCARRLQLVRCSGGNDGGIGREASYLIAP